MSRLMQNLAVLDARVARARRLEQDAADSETLGLLALELESVAAGETPDAYALRDLAELLGKLDDQRHPWAALAAHALVATAPPAGGEDGLTHGLAHEIEVGRRVVSTHRFFEGHTGPTDFREVVSTLDGDIRVGVGLTLNDGTLQRFLSLLARRSGHTSPLLALQPYFDVEARPLAAAVDGGPNAVTAYLRSQLILRRDPRLHRVVGSLPELWHTRFARLAASQGAQRLQLELAYGPRLVAARSQALRLGVGSLRGLALLFDTHPLLTQPHTHPANAAYKGEPERLMSLADRILARVHGPAARHWEERVRSIIDGVGAVNGRAYVEDHLLGVRADLTSWSTANDGLGNPIEGHGPTSIPLPGRDYLVQPGDHLSRIARLAYGGRADYRYLLAHNAELHAPGELRAGQRLHIPRWPPPRPERPLRLVEPTPLESRMDGAFLRMAGRSIGPLEQRPDDELAATAASLSELPLTSLWRARGVRLPEGPAVFVDNQRVVALDDRDRNAAHALFPASAAALEDFARHLASQLRGDIVLEPGHALPFGDRPADPHRRRWVRSALLRAEENQSLERVTLSLPPELRPDALYLDLADSTGQTLLRLEPEDLAAIRRQPARRLVDLQLSPVELAVRLATLWVADLRRRPCEALVAPVSTPRNFRLQDRDDETLILAPIGSPIFPVARGVVHFCGPTTHRGLAIAIEHHDGLFSRYTHLATVAVRPGQSVRADQLIGRAGMSGEAREPCVGLAFERRADTSRVTLHAADAEPLPVRDWLGKLLGDPGPVEVVRLAVAGSADTSSGGGAATA